MSLILWVLSPVSSISGVEQASSLHPHQPEKEAGQRGIPGLGKQVGAFPRVPEIKDLQLKLKVQGNISQVP